MKRASEVVGGSFEIRAHSKTPWLLHPLRQLPKLEFWISCVWWWWCWRRGEVVWEPCRGDGRWWEVASEGRKEDVELNSPSLLSPFVVKGAVLQLSSIFQAFVKSSKHKHQ